MKRGVAGFTLMTLALCLLVFNGLSSAQADKAANNGSTQKNEAAEVSYKRALPGYTWQFPRDHGAHPAYKTEWWYYTGHLESDTGQRFGYQFTLFQSGSALSDLPTHTAWALPHLLIGHLALTDIDGKQFYYDERFGRPGGLVGHSSTNKLSLSLRDWQLYSDEQGRHRIKARAEEGAFSLDLALAPSRSPVLHGENGYSQKADCLGCASQYYSLTGMNTTGTIRLKGQPSLKVAGTSWMDHEFGSNQLTEAQTGWDWFSITLETGDSLMLYQLRLSTGSADPNSSGTWIPDKGKPEHLPLSDFTLTPLATWTSPHTGGVYPAKWNITVPTEQLKLEVIPLVADQELRLKANTGVTYWEGACEVRGTHKGKPVNGHAYVELTGYAEQFRQKL